MADSPLQDATNSAQQQPNTAAPRAIPQKTCPVCDAKWANSKKKCDCGHKFVSKTQRDAAAAPPLPPRPDRKKPKVESAEDQASQERVDAMRALKQKVDGLSTARLARDRTISKGDIDIALGLLGGPQQILRPSKGYSDDAVFKVFSGLAEEHNVSMEPRDSLTILEHAVDVVKKLVVELSSLGDAALAEKLDAVKDRMQDSRIAKCQESGGLTNPEIRQMGTVASVASHQARVQEFGCSVVRTRTREIQERLGYYDSGEEECDASTNRLRYLQFDHGPFKDEVHDGPPPPLLAIAAVDGNLVIVEGGFGLLAGIPVARLTLSRLGALGVYRDHSSDSLIGTISHEDGERYCVMKNGANNGPNLHAPFGKGMGEVTLVLNCRRAPADEAAEVDVEVFQYLESLGADVTDYREAGFAEDFGSAKISFPGVDHGLLVGEFPIMSKNVFEDKVLGHFEANGSIAKILLVNYSLPGEVLKRKYRERLAKLSRFAPQTAALCEILAVTGHWSVQLRTKVEEWTSDSRPQHIDHEVPRRTTQNPRFKLDEPGVT